MIIRRMMTMGTVSRANRFVVAIAVAFTSLVLMSYSARRADTFTTKATTSPVDQSASVQRSLVLRDTVKAAEADANIYSIDTCNAEPHSAIRHSYHQPQPPLEPISTEPTITALTTVHRPRSYDDRYFS